MSLTCTSTGRPAPVLTWYKNNRTLSDNELYSITQFSHPTVGNETIAESVLMIIEPQKEYQGNHMCKASGKLRFEVTYKDVTVYCKFQFCQEIYGNCFPIKIWGYVLERTLRESS